MLRKYKIGFDIWGLMLFFVIMIPNFIWFVIPSPNDILREDSVTPYIDRIASVCQVLMVAFLCFLIKIEQNEVRTIKWVCPIIFFCIFYYMSWGCYYLGITNLFVVLGLTIPPCLAFIIFDIYRKNMIAVIPTTIFTICHLTYAIMNFVN